MMKVKTDKREGLRFDVVFKGTFIVIFQLNEQCDCIWLMELNIYFKYDLKFKIMFQR